MRESVRLSGDAPVCAAAAPRIAPATNSESMRIATAKRALAARRALSDWVFVLGNIPTSPFWVSQDSSLQRTTDDSPRSVARLSRRDWDPQLCVLRLLEVCLCREEILENFPVTRGKSDASATLGGDAIVLFRATAGLTWSFRVIRAKSRRRVFRLRQGAIATNEGTVHLPKRTRTFLSKYLRPDRI